VPCVCSQAHHAHGDSGAITRSGGFTNESEDDTVSSKWSDAWNELTPEVRHIGAMAEAEMRIQQLLLEKARLKKHYLNSVAEVDAHIRNLREWIASDGNRMP
jgi:hypothetical protein